jgi:hypothetical protein
MIHVFLNILNPGDRIVKYTGDTVSANDTSTPIGYPPLHMHHVHVYANHLPHWFETHGDYPLDAHGYSLSSPPLGTCVVVKEEPCTLVQEEACGLTKVFAQVNDVRFSTSTSMATGASREEQTKYERASLDALRATGTPYRWYFRIQFELELGSASSTLGASSAESPSAAASTSIANSASTTDAAIAGAEPPRTPSAPIAVASTTGGCQPVHKVVLMYPVDEHASHDFLRRFDCGSRQALFTYSLELPCSGTPSCRPAGCTHTARGTVATCCFAASTPSSALSLAQSTPRQSKEILPLHTRNTQPSCEVSRRRPPPSVCCAAPPRRARARGAARALP